MSTNTRATVAIVVSMTANTALEHGIRVVPPHGTRRRYAHRTLACDCPACTAANAAYQRAYRARARTGEHWTPDRWEQLTLRGVR